MSSAKFPIRGTKVVSPYPVQLTPGEHRLIFSLQKIFAPENILADCYFPKPDSKNHASATVSSANLLQIDCLAVDARGIFVFESKDLTGWVYGHGDRAEWTQVSAYGQNKHAFFSPVRQNARHLTAIHAVFGDQIPLFSAIVFGRDTTLKVLENIPPEHRICTQGNIAVTLAKIKSPHHFSDAEVRAIVTKLESSRVNPSAIVRADHIAEVKSYTKK